jgi:hypothetical protein
MPSFADDPPEPDATMVLPAGLACSDFDLQVDIFGGPQVNREFVDKDGNVVRTLLAGKGSTLVFTNLSSFATLTTRPNGSVSRTVLNPDGSSTTFATGHNVIIFFPTDVPPGPTTTLYVGRVVYTVDPYGTWTLGPTSGTASDLCAALSD